MHMEHVAKKDDIVVPGDLLGLESEYSKGEGTCIRGGNLYATLVGRVSINTDKEPPKPVISVVHRKTCLNYVPSVGLLTICRVINISERQARVSMLSVGDKILPEPLHGIIRREDIRAMEKDTVEIFNSFRPRDLVRARVIAYGESQLYVLSTAENELGVVLSTCECGENMVPVNWCEMQCSKTCTGNKEKRKVAKVVDAIPILI